MSLADGGCIGCSVPQIMDKIDDTVNSWHDIFPSSFPSFMNVKGGP